MKILVDTHVFLWLISGNKSLSPGAEKAFLLPANELYFSAASFWEICIKVSIKKLDLGKHWEKLVEKELKANSITWLPIQPSHCLKTVSLPWHHRDPFDRLLVAQALTEKLSIMTDDSQINRYDCTVVW